jgi:hypothetical protein
MREFISPRGNDFPNPVTQDVAVSLAQRARRDKGFTWRTSDGVFPEVGFAVSVKGPERQLEPGQELYALDLVAFGHEHAQVIAAGNLVFGGGVCIGAWYNSARNRWYLDLTIVVKTLDDALTLGRGNEQLAVFDLAGNREIAIPLGD